MSSDQVNVTERVNALLTQAREGLNIGEDTELLVVMLHRVAVELNKNARSQAAARKGAPDWGSWAGLGNTTRGLVLQASTCRDMLKKIKSTESTTANDQESQESELQP